jgi:hypothetical protein
MRIVAIFCQISLFFRSKLINMIEAIKPIDEALLVNEDTQPAKYGKELRLLLEEISQNYDHPASWPTRPMTKQIYMVTSPQRPEIPRVPKFVRDTLTSKQCRICVRDNIYVLKRQQNARRMSVYRISC